MRPPGAYKLLPRESGHRAEGRIHILEHAGGIDHAESILHGLEEGRLPSRRLEQGFLGVLALGDVLPLRDRSHGSGAIRGE